MMTNQHASCKRQTDRGVSILIIAVSMIFILGMAGLGIDLASLYVARSEAQRAADAAALAGAQDLVTNSCVNASGKPLNAYCTQAAIQQAKTVGNKNLIVGVSPHIGKVSGDVKFLSTSPNDPQIQVIASRDIAHKNPMPTFFVKIFGIDTANVSASAVAEAYASSGDGSPVGATCVKPWLIPNCDQYNTQAGEENTNCGSSSPHPGMFVVPNSNGSPSTTVAANRYQTFNQSNPTGSNSGFIGEPFTMKPGSPGDVAAPGQYYAAYIPDDTTAPKECPVCAKTSGGSGNGTGSAAVYRENIECCNQNPIVCGSDNITLASTAGNMVGPTQQGVDCLIHQDATCGQDYLAGINSPCVNNTPPEVPTLNPDGPPYYKIMAGPNNTSPGVVPKTQIPSQESSSVISVPIWDGTPLTSGQNPDVNIVGFMTLFVQDEGPQQGTVYGTILDVTACGSSSSTGSTTGSSGGAGGPIIGAGGSPIPVRLIKP